MKKLLIGLTGAGLCSAAYLEFIAEKQQKKDVYGVAKSIVNLMRATVIFTQCSLDYIYKLNHLEYNSDEYVAERNKIHTISAKRVLYLSEVNRGVYLKLGQYLGNLDRIMPREWTDVLKVLQDSGPYVSFEEIRVVVDHDQKKPLEEVFESFEKIPIAAASLAQVHKAKLKDGPEVAVKLQFPFLRAQVPMDLFAIKYIAIFVNKLLLWNNYMNLDLLRNFEIFKSSLLIELDFCQEVVNAEKTRELFKNNSQIKIPKNFIEYSNGRMIVQEFVQGPKINDSEGIRKIGLNPVEVAKLLVDTFADMIFKYGHIHCDAHPGNIFVQPHKDNPKKPALVLLDHGFYRQLPKDFRVKFSQLWVSLMSFDYENVKKISDELGIGDYYKTVGSTKKLGDPINEVILEQFSVGFIPIKSSNKTERKYLREKDMLNLENVNHFMNSLPPDMLFIIRASNLIGIHNSSLGGSTRYRLIKFSELAMENVYPNFISRLWAKIRFIVKIYLLEHFPSIYRTLYTVAADV